MVRLFREARIICEGRGLHCRGGEGKEWMGWVSSGRPQSFRSQRRPVDYDHIMNAAQDEGEWRKTAEQEAERFIAKWIAAQKARAGLGHAAFVFN